MTFIKNHIPLFLKLYWKLRDDILFRERLPGDRLPNVEDLHARYGVSQSTVHKALDLLEREGLITKKRAIGIFVNKEIKAQQWDQMFTPESFKAELGAFDLHLLSEGWIKGTKSLQSLFAGEEGVFKQNRLYRWQALLIHQKDPRRKIFASTFLPAWAVSGVPVSSITKNPLDNLIQLGRHKTSQIRRISRPWICDSEIATRLGILEGTAIFRRLLKYFTREDRLLACCDYMTTAHASYQETRIDWKKIKKQVTPFK